MFAFLAIAIFVSFLGWYSYNLTAANEYVDYYRSCEYYYRYNDRFGIASPPVRLQEKRFNYARMFRAVPQTSVEPKGLNEYKFGETNNIGVFPNWDTDNKVLGDACYWIVSLCYYYLRGVKATDPEDNDENGSQKPKKDERKNGTREQKRNARDVVALAIGDSGNNQQSSRQEFSHLFDNTNERFNALLDTWGNRNEDGIASAKHRRVTRANVDDLRRSSSSGSNRIDDNGGAARTTAASANDKSDSNGEQNPQPRRQLCVKIMRDFVHRYDATIRKATNNKFDKVFPWGVNWYQFSITSCLALYHYMIVMHEEGLRDEVNFAADLVLSIIETPKRSLGMDRDQANSIYMGLPWIVAHYFRGDVKDAAQHEDYKYVVEYIKFPMVTERKTQGLYLDKAYVTHTNVLAYGYLSEMTKMSLPIVAFDNTLRNFMLDWSACKRLLAHPTIPYSTIGLYTRATKLSSFVNPDSTLGIAVVPTTLILRMYGPDYAFAVRGINDWIAFYESDKSDDTMAQYWVQSRKVFFADTDYHPTFPEPGFYHQKWEDEARKTPVTSRLRIPTLRRTTTSFAPAKITNRYLSFPFVFAYGNIGLLRHFYMCNELRYGNYEENGVMKNRNKTRNYGAYSVDEFVTTDYAKGTIDIWARIQMMNLDCGIMVMHAEVPVEHNVAKKGAVFLFHMRWDVKTRKLTHSPIRSLDSTYDELAKVYPPGIEVVNTDNTVMLIDHGQPKIAMYPDRRTVLDTTFVTVYEGKEYNFVFDSLTNQYWVAGLCIDK